MLFLIFDLRSHVRSRLLFADNVISNNIYLHMQRERGNVIDVGVGRLICSRQGPAAKMVKTHTHTTSPTITSQPLSGCPGKLQDPAHDTRAKHGPLLGIHYCRHANTCTSTTTPKWEGDGSTCTVQNICSLLKTGAALTDSLSGVLNSQ